MQRVTPKERRRLNREATLNDILTIARELMRANGVAALNLNEISRQLGMKTPSLYEYFPSKSAVYDALFRLGWELFDSTVVKPIGTDLTFWDSMRQIFNDNLRFAHDNPELYELMTQRPVPGFRPTKVSMDLSIEIQEKADRLFSAAIESGDVPRGLSMTSARDLMLSMMTGLTVGHLSNDQDSTFESGRFSGLVDEAVAIFRAAWESTP